MMRHKYLPRSAARVLTSVLAAGAGFGSGGCSDPAAITGPTGRNGQQLEFVSSTTPDQTTGRLGVDFKVRFRSGTPINSVVLYVDSGTAGQRAYTVKPTYPSYGVPDVSGPAFADTPGRHTFTALATALNDTLGASVRFERTFSLGTVAYTVSLLPDLGAGAGVRGLTPTGVVTGWVTGAGGHTRAVVWRNGALAVLPTPDSADAVAVQTNTAGDVLLQFGPRGAGAGRAVGVYRADGTTLVLGPLGVPATAYAPAFPYACCSVAAGLNDRREVLAYGNFAYMAYRSALFDAGTGAVKDTTSQHFFLLNNSGQLLGQAYSSAGFGYDSYYPTARGFAFPKDTLVGLTLPGCDSVGRWSTTAAVALDDSANFLENACGNLGFVGARRGAWLDEFLGRVDVARLSPQGTWVIGLHRAAGTLYRWQAATQTTEAVTVGGAWAIDSLAAVNGSGQIAAHGVDRATGRGAALLLTPAP